MAVDRRFGFVGAAAALMLVQGLDRRFALPLLVLVLVMVPEARDDTMSGQG